MGNLKTYFMMDCFRLVGHFYTFLKIEVLRFCIRAYIIARFLHHMFIIDYLNFEGCAINIFYVNSTCKTIERINIDLTVRHCA